MKKQDNRILERCWSDVSRFLSCYLDDRVRILFKQHENIDPSCFVPMVQAFGRSLMAWRAFSEGTETLDTNEISFDC